MDTFTGIVYSRNLLTGTENTVENYINQGDSIEKIKGYTEDYTTLNSSYFLKHIMNNGVVESSEVCFIHNGLHCIKPNEYETSKASLLSIFGEGACYVLGSNAFCDTDAVYVSADGYGGVSASDDTAACGVYSAGSASCNLRE